MDQIIPLDNSPNQVFAINVNIDGGNVLSLILHIRFNTMAGYWTMAILDSGGKMLVDSIPLLTGDWPAANLLEQYSYMTIGSAYILNVGNSPLDYPDSTTLGTEFILLWGDTAGATLIHPFTIGQVLTPGPCGPDAWVFNELVAGSGTSWSLEFTPDNTTPGPALWLFGFMRQFGSVLLRSPSEFTIVDNIITTITPYDPGDLRAFYRKQC